MYHIKDDKRSKTSAALICEGLNQCLKEKTFSKITITDVQQASTVGRATFYRNFDSLADVLTYQCDLVFEQLFEIHEKKQTQSVDELMFFFIDSWMKQNILLEAIVSSNRTDILYDVYRSKTDKFKKQLSINIVMSEEQLDFLVAIATSCLAGILIVWIQHGKKESAKQLLKVVKNSIKIFSMSIQ